MSPIFIVLLSITCLFFLMLVIKRITNWKVCAICASVSITWIVLLFLFWAGRFPHPLIIGILMGQSVIGIYYLLEKKLEERWHVFRLPFLLTATLGVAIALGEFEGWKNATVLIAGVWLIFLFLHASRTNPKIKKVVERIIACCKNW